MLWLYRLLARLLPNDVTPSSAGAAGAMAAGALAAGALAPDFVLPADDGSLVRLRDVRGRPVVLFFYPRDDSPT